MSAALLSAVNDLDLPPEPGISPRAARTVLRVYCKIAHGFRYGLRGSKIASLADYSLATVRRVQRYLVNHGFLEKIRVGGGRPGLHPLADRPGEAGDTTRQPSRRDTPAGPP